VKLDVGQYPGGHGDIGTRKDVPDGAQMLQDFDAGMRAAVAKGVTPDEIVKAEPFAKYRNIRNYYRMNLFVSSYNHFLKTGRPENLYP
jgi:hypothetical protein